MSDQPLDRLEALHERGWSRDLDSINALLAELGNPEKGLRAIHVAGTNGKSSVCAYATSILRESGHKVGTYTSPHVQDVGERIRIDNEPTDDKTLSKVAQTVLDAADKVEQAGNGEPTYFEVLTAMAFQHFADVDVDVVVCEVGLGGRLDATNVFTEPYVTAITNISREHAHLLGDSDEHIAREKAGIVKKGVPVLTGAEGLALKAIWSEAATRRAPLKVLRSLGRPKVTRSDLDGIEFTIPNRDWGEALTTKMPGEHMATNAALAAYACELAGEEGLEVSEDAYAKGIEDTFLPARLQVLHKAPAFVVDGAHNPDACKTVKAWVQDLEFERVFLLYGVMKDKDFGTMTEIMAPMAQEVFVTQPPGPRGLNAKALAGEAKRFCSRVRESRDLETALKTLLGTAGADDLILSFGSLYLAGEILKTAPKVLE